MEEHAGFTDVFFYTDLTNPYAGYVLNLKTIESSRYFDSNIYAVEEGADRSDYRLWSQFYD